MVRPRLQTRALDIFGLGGIHCDARGGSEVRERPYALARHMYTRPTGNGPAPSGVDHLAHGDEEAGAMPLNQGPPWAACRFAAAGAMPPYQGPPKATCRFTSAGATSLHQGPQFGHGSGSLDCPAALRSSRLAGGLATRPVAKVVTLACRVQPALAVPPLSIRSCRSGPGFLRMHRCLWLAL